MAFRFVFTVAVCLCMAAGAAAQVVRFETTVGDFDMVLNPTKNPLLQGHVDNMLQYVRENRYEASWINRAVPGFVLQMGGLYSNTLRPAPTVDSVRGVFTNDPVQGHPQIPGLLNTVGTVALALPSDANQIPIHDEGTSSFFVNLASNTKLDPDFTVFAEIPDMTVINQIMGLKQVDLTLDPNFGASGGTFSNVPVTADGKLVFVKRAFVVSDSVEAASAVGTVPSALSASQTADDAAAETILSSATPSLIESGAAPSSAVSVANVPEPSGLCLAALGFYAFANARRSRRLRTS